MVERDEDGRPRASRNAGAFLGPFSGVVPVPSDLLDRYWRGGREAGGRRRGRMLLVLALLVGVVIVLVVLWAITPADAAGLTLARV